VIERSEFGFIALTPAGKPDPSLAIAGSRAGALGVLNLEFCFDQTSALDSLGRLLTYGRGRLGVLVDGGAIETLTPLLDKTSGLDSILVTSSALEQLGDVIGLIHRHQLKAYLVVSSAEAALAGQAAGVDALVAKGNEAGGWVGDETSFVLLQRLVSLTNLPIWVQGGIGLHTAAACYVAGAAGVVLDNQLLLTDESPLPDSIQTRLRAMDGSEAVCVGGSFDAPFRAYLRPSLASADEIRRLETTFAVSGQSPPEVRRAWRESVSRRVNYLDVGTSLLAIGQDAAFAAGLARRFRTVGGVVAALRRAIHEHVDAAQRYRPLAEGAPLAQSHGTRYPIVQGPMTRVSDRADFAAAVAREGALPFLALALMRGPEVRDLLEETRQRLTDRPWGVGILGFVPQDLRTEQLEVIRSVRPPFALIAGGRPDQARLLEAEGIPTYLHVPSPGLLKIFLDDGAHRFVFEGRECGGHVGPRTSFVLWESMIDVLLAHVPADSSAETYHVLFAGGVHDELSAAMVATLAAPLAERGIRIGVLLGTAYIFTQEAVQAGAIVAAFQQAAVDSDRTALLESGPGHATRCLPSPFVEDFGREKRLLLQDELSSEEIRNRLEELNIGHLRIASKGVERHPRYGQDPSVPKLVPVGLAEQWSRGMYMIGQVAALRKQVCTVAELHQEVSVGSSLRLASVSTPRSESPTPAPEPAAVAIVGMSALLPGASDLPTYWQNIMNKVDAITEVPPSRWDWRQYYDPDRNARDKVYSRWGGFLPEIAFDPVTYGMPPNSLRSIEPFQLLTLHVVRAALQDAGFLDRPFPRERTSVILGAGGGAGDLGAGYIARSAFPTYFGESAADLVEKLDGVLPEWTEDSFAGILMNVAAGRVANRFDLGGVNYTVDAACASSLAAVYVAVRDLEARTSDVVIVGGVDALQNPFAYLCFSKTQALSPTGHCRTFDATSDGIAIGEGFAAVVLKRLEDAERDGDKIYAVIRAVGGSSDGRDRGLTAPRPEGQIRALERAYDQARFSPATVGLIEAHGTGTVAGDQAEVQALTKFFSRSGAGRHSTAIGSVKSMIGHTKATAGVAGLTKVALALHHQVLPPTLGVTQPNPKAGFSTSPLYVNSEARPWISGIENQPRRAGVSAFGFGGTNFHIVVEEYQGNYLPERSVSFNSWPAELLLWRAPSRKDLLQSITTMVAALRQGARPRLADLAFTLATEAGDAVPGGQTIGIVAESLSDLQEKLGRAADLLRSTEARLADPRGVYYSEVPLAPTGKVAFLFPGQGSQVVNMARDVALMFEEVRESIGQADQFLVGRLPEPLSRYVYPPPAFTPEAQQLQQAALTETNIAQPALGAVSLAMARLLSSLGIEPELLAGHSYGELVALHAAGCFDAETLLHLSEARGRFMREGSADDAGTMAAVDAGPDQLRSILDNLEITIANLNAPNQTVISGSQRTVEGAIARCKEAGLRARKLPVACAFHSPLVAPAQQRFAAVLRSTPLKPPSRPVFSNTTAAQYPSNPDEIVSLLAEHLVRPVDFVAEISAMHDAGARLFVEVGPRSVLTGLVGRILDGRSHLCVALDQPGRNGVVQLLHSLAALAAEGVPVRAEHFYRGRSLRRLDWSKLQSETDQPTYSPTTWLVDGGRATPALNAPSACESTRHPVLVDVREARPDERPAMLDAPPVPATAPATSNPPASKVGSPETRTYVQQREDDMITEQKNGTSGSAVPPPAVGTNGSVHRSESPPRPEFMPPRPAAPPVQSVVPMNLGTVRGSRADEVVSQFQEVMQRFLDTQRSVMLAYLGRPESYAPTTGTPLPAARSIAARPPLSEERLPVIHHAPPQPAPPAARVAPAPNAPAREVVSRPTVPEAPPARERAAHQPVAETAQRSSRSEPPAVAAPTTGSSHASGLQPSVPLTAVLRRDQLTKLVQKVVSERTGYPPEMLGLDVDLEADLGIDSIKRVEVVGTLVRALALPPGVHLAMDSLTSSRTLNQLLDRLEEQVAPPDSPKRSEPAEARVGRARVEGDQRPFEPAADEESIGRFTLRPILVPPPTKAAGLARSGVVVITEDDQGVAVHLESSLVRAGYRAIRIGVAPGNGGPSPLAADLSQPDQITRLVDRLHQEYGSVSALVHLAPLRQAASGPANDPELWHRRLADDLTGFFLLAQALRGDFEAAAEDGGSAVLAATSLGGAFATADVGLRFFPGHGGIAGFLKTLATEWTTVRVKSLDFGPATAESVAASVLSELTAADGIVEVGYRDGKRHVVGMDPSPVDRSKPGLSLDRNSTILITGGARGITALAALRLAREFRPRLIIVGRTRLPDGPESPETANLATPVDLKRALIEQRRRDGKPITIAAIESAYDQLRRERDVRLSLAQLREAGSSVEYHDCDVRDVRAFSALIDAVYQSYGRIDGVIHGAGIVEDKLVRDKKLDSFDRVIQTKVDSALVLAAKLRPETLRFLIFFSSVSGRFGNRGQADYAAASEILNKLAVQLDQQWPGHVVSINWGPWQTAGMVSPDVQRQFAERGVEFIPPDVGCQKLVDEIRFGTKGQAEVVVGGHGLRAAWTGQNGRETRPTVTLGGSSNGSALSPPGEVAVTASAPQFPLLTARSTVTRDRSGQLDVTRVLDLQFDRYLQDHCLSGRPVLPVAFALELMAEAAAVAWPGLNVVAVRDFRLFRGVILDRSSKSIRVVVGPSIDDATTTDNGQSSTVVPVSIFPAGGSSQSHYLAEVELRGPGAPGMSGGNADPVNLRDPLPLVDGEHLAKSMVEVYRDWLFHGPLLQNIASIEAIGPSGVSATFLTSSPEECLNGAGAGKWLIDPVVVDCCLQLQIVWARWRWGITSLPNAIQEYRRVSSARPLGDDRATSVEIQPRTPIRCELRILPESAAPVSLAQHYLYAPDGRLLGFLDAVELTGSTMLNRLTPAGASPVT
jgi:acyl transferase domain-containing protein/NAD(P)H-dependent flavin oxidoreductase YrpB (nitropropane dioxygenase family)/NAD(P)-dependent dehydrogenase (short-subunit alcohol dehydrogenase family)